jgi:hypothetical protein
MIAETMLRSPTPTLPPNGGGGKRRASPTQTD